MELRNGNNREYWLLWLNQWKEVCKGKLSPIRCGQGDAVDELEGRKSDRVEVKTVSTEEGFGWSKNRAPVVEALKDGRRWGKA